MKSVLIMALVFIALPVWSAPAKNQINKVEGKKVTVKTEMATFAGGCFWCMEAPFEVLKGVSTVVSGYTGGLKKNPKYEEVSSGKTGHLEAVQVTFDPAVVSYQQLLEVFWRQIDPTDAEGQFVDRGTQYSTAIFYHSPEQLSAAEVSKKHLAESVEFNGKKIVTPILPAVDFYPAEEYHQDFYKNNSLKYKYYRWNSGRDEFLQKIWGKK